MSLLCLVTEHPDDMSSLHGNGDFDSTGAQRKRPHESLSEANGVVLALNGRKHWYCIFVPRGVKLGLEDSGYSEALNCWMDRVREGQMPRLYLRQWPGLYTHDCSMQDEEDDM